MVDSSVSPANDAGNAAKLMLFSASGAGPYVRFLRTVLPSVRVPLTWMVRAVATEADSSFAAQAWDVLQWASGWGGVGW